MHFIRVAATQYDSGTTTPAVGTERIWINLDQVTTITEHLGSNRSDPAVDGRRPPIEHYPSIRIATADGRTHLVPLGSFPEQASAFLAIQRFTAALVRYDTDSFETGLAALLDRPASTPTGSV